MNTERILIVEDGTTVSLLMRRALESAGFDVSVVEDGIDALDAVRSERFDVILLDQLLPGITGTEILQRWAAEGLTTPVIVVSAVAGESDIVRNLELGAVDFMEKPFSIRELVARVRVQIRQTKLHG